MSCILSDGTHQVDLQWGPEWGYQSSLDMGLRWSRMTSGQFRFRDLGPARDRWGSLWRHRADPDTIASLRALVHDTARGAALTLTASDGLLPFGPLFPTATGLSVILGPIQPGGQIGATRLHASTIALYLDPTPMVPLEERSLAPLLSRNRYVPSPEASWGIEPRMSGYGVAGSGEDTLQTVAYAQLTTADLASVLRAILFLRGGSFGVSADAKPFGPGAPGSSSAIPAGGFLARCISVGWTQVAPTLWDCSANLVRDP